MALASLRAALAAAPTPMQAQRATRSGLRHAQGVYVVLGGPRRLQAGRRYVEHLGVLGYADNFYARLSRACLALAPTHAYASNRSATQAAVGHLADIEEYVDAVYMMLANAARAQAKATRDALVRNLRCGLIDVNPRCGR